MPVLIDHIGFKLYLILAAIAMGSDMRQLESDTIWKQCGWSIPEELNPPGIDKTDENDVVAIKGNKVEYDGDKSLSFLFVASAVFP